MHQQRSTRDVFRNPCMKRTSSVTCNTTEHEMRAECGKLWISLVTQMFLSIKMPFPYLLSVWFNGCKIDLMISNQLMSIAIHVFWIYSVSEMSRDHNHWRVATGNPHKRRVCLFVWNIKKCMEEYWRVLYRKRISRNGQVKAQNKCTPTSIVVCCRFCGSKWRIWAILWVLRWLLLYVKPTGEGGFGGFHLEWIHCRLTVRDRGSTGTRLGWGTGKEK